jgi:hypothetical protein
MSSLDTQGGTDLCVCYTKTRLSLLQLYGNPTEPGKQAPDCTPKQAHPDLQPENDST